MNLAIVGSRDYINYRQFKKIVNEYIIIFGNPDIIISGGCKGVDKLAEKYAIEKNIELIVYIPNWNKYGKSAGPKRNNKIINNSTHVLAFPSKNSKGTYDTIRKAQKNNLHLIIKEVNI